jgi:RHS repeat-associated protein
VPDAPEPDVKVRDSSGLNRERRSLLLLATIVLGGASILGSFVANTAGGTPPSLSNARIVPRVRPARKKSESHRYAANGEAAARVARRAHQLGSPRAEAQRQNSRGAYRDVGAPQAKRLLSADFGHVLDGIAANPAATIADQGKVIHYLNDYSAQVRTPTGYEVETSTAPLRVSTGAGTKLPVDLELERSGGHIVPTRPLQSLVIGGHARQGVTLTDSGISLTMLGANSAATMVEDKEVLYPEVGEDVDEVATPKLNGADLSALIRSPESPQELRYHVGVPLGAKLVAGDSGAVIRRGQKLIARIPAPWARDAQETVVPTEMQISGDDLVVKVDHRQGSYAYPILLDPELLEVITESSEGWAYSSGEGFGNEFEGLIGPSGGSYLHSGPGALALSLTNETGDLPVESPPETSYEEGGRLADKFVSQQEWLPNLEDWINAIYFDGISSSGISSAPAYSRFEIEACNEWLSWNSSETAPTAHVFTGLNGALYWWNCRDWGVPGGKIEPSSVRVRVVTGTNLSSEQVSEWRYGHKLPEQVEVGPATLSVAAIVVARPLTWQELEELKLANSSTYGDGNPAQLRNTDCFVADPVNCATGNLTETQEDLSVGGVGPGLHARRSYNSQLAAVQSQPGNFGFGWTGSHEGRIALEEVCIANCWSGTDVVHQFGKEGEEEGVEAGLVAAYAFDEGEGETANDSAGEHDGSITGAEWTTGKFGPALRFLDNQNDKVTVPSSSELELVEGFTVDAWVRPGKAEHYLPVVTKEASSYLGYELAVGSAGGLWGYISPEGTIEESLRGSESLPQNTWSYVALTFEGANLRLYLDGELVGQEAMGAPQGGTGPLYIGRSELFESGFVGKIDEVRIYDRALDAEEIQTDEVTPIGTTEGSEGPEEEEPEEEEVREQIAIVHQDNGSTAEFRRIKGETAWAPVGQLNRALLADEGEGFVYTLPDQTVLSFGHSGLLNAEEDRNGNTVTINRDEEGRILSVGDESGRELLYSYDPEGFVESIEDPAGHVVHYEYEDGNLVAVSQPGSTEPRWQFGYDHDSELTSLTDGRGETTKTRYRAFRAASQEDPMGRVTSWSYSLEEAGSTTTISEPNGSETVEQFNESGLVSSVTRAAGTPLAATTTYEYNPADELIAVTNPEEETTEVGYGVNGDKISETDPEGHETTWTYNRAHEVTAETWPSGEETTVERDAHGNPQSVSRPAPESEIQTDAFDYGPHGELESMMDPVGATWTYGYDAEGDLESEVDPEGNERTWAYDEDSRVISTVSPRGNTGGAEPAEFTTSIERDPQGRPLKIEDPLGGTTEYSYDEDGDLKWLADPNGNQTWFTYDPDGEQTEVERSTGAVEETGYDEAGQVTRQTNGGEGETTYVRNLLEEPVETIDPLGRVTTRTFYKGGNLESETDPESRTTTFGYDEDGRLEGIEYSDGMTPDVSYGYDEDGDLTSMVDGTGDSAYEYDQLDRLVHGEDGNGEATAWEYDLADEPIGLTYPNGKSISREFDEAGRLESITDWLGHTTSFTYSHDSEPTATVFPLSTGDADEYSYDRADRMSGVTMRQGAETLASVVYSRDPAGQAESLVGEGLPGSAEEEFGYDEDERLSEAGESGYGYDAANNLTEAPGTTNSYDEADQLESTAAATFAYDEEGDRTGEDPTTGPTTTYAYDQAGRLTGVERVEEGETPAISESFTYDGTGSMASRTAGPTTSHLVWDPTASPSSLLTDGAASYIYGPGGLAIEQISSEEVPTYLHHDQLGSTRLLTNASGEDTGTFTYGAYGVLTGHTGTATAALGYAGQYTPGQSGLIYLRARYYDPATAQFLTLDPQVAATRAPYIYGNDNPVNRRDLTGGASESAEGHCPNPICFPSPTQAEAKGAAEAVEALPGEAKQLGEEVASSVGGFFGSIFGGGESGSSDEASENSEPCAEPVPPGHNPDTWERREGSRNKSGQNWWDPEGGEWHWHAPDRFHPEGHWDYNPWEEWNSEWDNVPTG